MKKSKANKAVESLKKKGILSDETFAKKVSRDINEHLERSIKEDKQKLVEKLKPKFENATKEELNNAIKDYLLCKFSPISLNPL